MARLSRFVLLVGAVLAVSPRVSSITNQDRFTPIAEGFYLPRKDVYGSFSHGKIIFASFPEKCTSVVSEPENNQKSTFYQESESFYQHVSTSTGISASLKGAFTMGTTLSAASDSFASLNTSVSGLSLDVYATKDYAVLDQDCVNSLELSPSLLDDLKSLPPELGQPEQKSSWVNYHTFLLKFGSHIVSEVHRGSRLLQWTFSKTSDNYNVKNLTTRACIDMANIPTEAGALGIQNCANYSEDKIESAMSMTVSNKLLLKGGTPGTRSKLHHDRSPALIQQFLQEAQTDPGAIEYRFLPIWEVLKIHFMGTNNDNFNRALMLEQYYKGFLDFGCDLQQDNGLTLRRFEYKSKPNEPEFACTLEHLGCHSDDDCHLRGNVGPTHCYGRTCVQAEPVEDAGSKQKEKLSIRMHREGHHDEVPNDSCYYHLPSRCHYTNGRDWPPKRKQIWPVNGREIDYALFRSLHRKLVRDKETSRQELCGMGPL